MELLPFAVQSGIQPSEFWEMAPSEILAVTQHNYKQRLIDNYNLANMIGNTFSKHPKSLYEIFPEMFREEAKQVEIRKLTAFMQAQMVAHKKK